MGLAAARNKQKLSQDPNNTKWTRNTDSFGQRMLRAHGWQPGEFLGARDAAHAAWHTAASASHIRVALKDDNLGLGARRNNGDECTGLGAFQDLLGRLNGKSEAVVAAERKAREDVQLSLYVEKRLGAVRFVSGGFLVGDQLEEKKEKEEQVAEEAEPASSGSSEESEEEEEEEEEEQALKRKQKQAGEKKAKKDKKSKKRRREENAEEETPETSDSHRSKKKKKGAKGDDGGIRPVEDADVETARPPKEKRKKSKRAPTEEQSIPVLSSPNTDVPESATDSGELSSSVAGKKEKKEKKRKSEKKSSREKQTDSEGKLAEKKKKKKRRKDEDDPAADSATVDSSTPAETVVSTPNLTDSGSSTPVPSGPTRHLSRQRFIAQKRMAFSDPKALNQIFMIKS